MRIRSYHRLLWTLLAVVLLAMSAWAGEVHYRYDGMGRLTLVEHENGPRITYTYDANGNLLSVSSVAVGVEPTPPRFSLALGRSFPDPASEVARIRFSIPRRERVRLEVFDMRGRRVAVPVDAIRDAGEYQAEFDARTRGSGVYVWRLRVGDRELSRRLVVIH